MVSGRAQTERTYDSLGSAAFLLRNDRENQSMILNQIVVNTHFLLLRVAIAVYGAGCVFVGYRLGVALSVWFDRSVR